MRPSHGQPGQRNYSYAQVWQCAPCVDHHRLISIHSTLSLSAFLRTARLLHSACACFSCIFFTPPPHITRSEITAGATRSLVGSRFDRRFRGPAVQPPGYAHVGKTAKKPATLVKPPVNRTGGGTPGYGGVLRPVRRAALQQQPGMCP